MGQQQRAFDEADACTDDSARKQIVYLQTQPHDPKGGGRTTHVFWNAEAAWLYVRRRLVRLDTGGWCIRGENVCELMRDARMHWLYYDVEYYASDASGETDRIESLCSLIQTTLPAQVSFLKTRGTRVLADGRTKISWHIHCVGVYTCGTPRCYADALFDTKSPVLYHDGLPIVDVAVYSRNRVMRTVFSSKPGGVPLMPEEHCETLEDCKRAFLSRLLRVVQPDDAAVEFPAPPKQLKASSKPRTLCVTNNGDDDEACRAMHAWLLTRPRVQTMVPFGLQTMRPRQDRMKAYRLVLDKSRAHECASGGQHNGGCGAHHIILHNVTTHNVYMQCFTNGRPLPCTIAKKLLGTFSLSA
jgi:hypothetical protein